MSSIDTSLAPAEDPSQTDPRVGLNSAGLTNELRENSMGESVLSPVSDVSLSNDDDRPEQESNTSDQLRSQEPQQHIGPIRVPGTYPPEWLPDNESDSCMSCNSLFTLIKRRHHCRSCGKLFCGECCRQRAKLLYLNNKEARICENCLRLIKMTLVNSQGDVESSRREPVPTSSTNSQATQLGHNSPAARVQGVLKTSNHSRSNDSAENPSSNSEQQSSKQVIFSDGIRPGTDLTESYPYPLPSSSSQDPSTAPFSVLSRQSREPEDQLAPQPSGSSHKSKVHRNSSTRGSGKTITVCDNLGYLPPILVSKNSVIGSSRESNTINSFTNLITSQLKITGTKNSPQEIIETRSLSGVMQFENIVELAGIDEVVTLLLLKDLRLKVKLVKKRCCMNGLLFEESSGRSDGSETCEQILHAQENQHIFWSFCSEGLSKFGQSEVVLVIDRGTNDSCIPRDVFKIFLTLHELSLRRQSLENLGNLLFQDGLFGSRDTAGILFVKPLSNHCFNELVLPNSTYLIALVLQRWEVPWSKVFPMRLLLRLGHKLGFYPYPVISFVSRDPVYYEVGHTIISILGDFRNFRYSLNHVEGLKVILNKSEKKVSVQLNYSSYEQFNKTLDSFENEHVLAWSSCPFPEADGHLVSVQNEDGHHETVEFYKKFADQNVSFGNLESNVLLGASFIIFSGALKVNQSGQAAKISIVEDGVLIQIQSCTMSALKRAIHFMKHFDVDCENEHDAWNKVEIDWQEST